MRTKPQAAAKPRPLPTPFTFSCTCCQVVEHRRTPALPDGWVSEEVHDDIYAYCPDCAIDLPGNATGDDQQGAVQ